MGKKKLSRAGFAILKIVSEQSKNFERIKSEHFAVLIKEVNFIFGKE